ncbi:MAG: hypothetical protein A2038_11830 [Deltaproteobacteria bacterium GWA2_57_13]|nr:MAG: hypothetical protein A2038_11830 [Deltaproteobacteria bacterium GWA2_57_13]
MGFEAKSRWGSDRNPGKWRPQKPASSTAASEPGSDPRDALIRRDKSVIKGWLRRLAAPFGD